MQTTTTTTPTALIARPDREEAKGQWLMVAGGVLLGTIGVFVQEAGQHPLLTVWFRCAFGVVALLLWSLATGRLQDLRLTGRKLGVACATAGLMVVNWALFFAAIQRTSIAVATVVFHVQPIWVILFGASFLRSAVSRGQWVCAVASLCGLALATGLFDDMSGTVHLPDSSYAVGLLLCVGASLSYAGVTLLTKSSHAISPLALAFWQCAVGTVVLAWAPFVFGWPAQPAAWAWLAGLGALHTGLAYVILFAGMARLGLGQIAVLQFVYPLAAIACDWLMYGNALSLLQCVGGALMGLAIWSIKKPHSTSPQAAG